MIRLIAALNENPIKRELHLFINVLFLVLTLEESNSAYLSENNPFKSVVRPRKYLIDRFFWTHNLTLWPKLT